MMYNISCKRKVVSSVMALLTAAASIAAVPAPEGLSGVELGASVPVGYSVARAYAAGDIDDEGSLLAAIAAAQSGDTITLTGDVTLTGVVAIGKDIVINGDGYTIYQTEAGVRHFEVAINRNFTLRQVTLDGNQLGGGIQAAYKTTLVVEDSTIQNCGHHLAAILKGGGISSQGHVALYDSHLKNNQAGWGGGAHIVSYGGSTNPGSLIVKGGSMEGNSAIKEAAVNGYGYGGAVYFNQTSDGRIEFTGTVLDGNYSDDVGGAVYIGYGKLTTKDTVFSDNYAGANGGAIYVSSQKTDEYTHLLEGTVITNNRAEHIAGGLYHSVNDQRVPLIIRGAEITHNRVVDESAKWYGGGIYMDTTIAVIENSKIEHNRATWGGGIMLNRSDVTIRNTSISYNTGLTHGGGIMTGATMSAIKIKIESGELIGNTAPKGGAMWIGARGSNSTPIFSTDIYPNIYLYEDVVMRDNQAEKSYVVLPEHRAVHETNILATQFSNGHKWAYNNDDIFYDQYREWTMAFESNGGTGIAPATVWFGNPVKTPQAPEKNDYVFSGWFADEALSIPWDFAADTMPDQNFTLYAKWKEKTCTVIFDTTGGSPTEPAEVVPGRFIPSPHSPTKEGHAFVDWYVDEELTQPWSFETEPMPSYNLTLYAKWEPIKYTVVFESFDGTQVPDQRVLFDTLVTKPTSPHKEGFIFEGWYKDAALITAWAFDADHMPGRNITLYARWTAEEDNSGDGGAGGNPGGNGGGGNTGPGNEGAQNPDPKPGEGGNGGTAPEPDPDNGNSHGALDTGGTRGKGKDKGSSRVGDAALAGPPEFERNREPGGAQEDNGKGGPGNRQDNPATGETRRLLAEAFWAAVSGAAGAACLLARKRKTNRP